MQLRNHSWRSSEDSFTESSFEAKLDASVYIGVMNVAEKSKNTVIALLVINKSQFLAQLAIKTIRMQSQAPIYVGYKNEEDIEDLRIFDSVYFIDLSNNLDQISSGTEQNSQYLEYTNLAFFQLVQLKWQLFLTLCQLPNVNRVIYSDLDVAWLSNPIEYFSRILDSDPQVQFCIQDQTFRSPLRDLCMGIFVFRANKFSLRTFEELASTHASALVHNPTIGDDGIITNYYRTLEHKSTIYLLPQMSFPVGSMANAFTNVGGFSQLMLREPYIFHANYVVGERKKLLLLLIILASQGIKVQITLFPLPLRIEFYLRKYALSLVNILRGS